MCEPSATVPRYSCGSSGVDADAVRPRPHVDPAEPPQPLLGLGRRGEVPRPGPAGQRGRVRLALADPAGRGLERGDVAGAAALGDEPAAGHEHAEQPREQPLVVGDPVERRGREDRVDRPLELELHAGRRRARRRRRRAARAPARPSPASRRRPPPHRAADAPRAPPSRGRCRSRRRAPARRRADPAGRARRGPSPRAAPTPAHRRSHSSRAAAYICTLSRTGSDPC